MRYLVVCHADGSQAAVPINDSSTITLKTWAPPSFSEDGPSGFPVLTEDQTFCLQGVQAVMVAEDAPSGATVVVTESELESLTDAQAAQLEAEAVEGVVKNPWED